MQKNFKSIFLGLVLIGGLGMIGCQSIQDEDEVKELEKVKIEVPVNKDEKEDEETKQLSLEEARDIGQNWVRKNVGSDCDIQYEKFTQSEDKLVADVYQVGEIKLGFIEVDRYTGKVTYNEINKENESKEENIGQCYDCGEYYPVSKMTFNGRSYHCGCYAGQCENCGSSVFYEGYTIADEKFRIHQSNGYSLCSECYEIEQLELYGPKCDWCKVEIPVDCKSYTDNGEILCSNCYIQYHDTVELNKIWICPTCGRENQGEVLCECEQ